MPLFKRKKESDDNLDKSKEDRATERQLKKDEKNNVSHRGKALRNFCKILEKQINHKSNQI